MINSEFSLMWEVLYKYSLEVDYDSSDPEEFSCILCKKLMIDACQSVCGCHYCHKCFLEYYKNGDKYCPGQKMECQKRYLSLDKDATRNSDLNNKISQLKVKCQFCFSPNKLIEMNEHLKRCEKKMTLSNSHEPETMGSLTNVGLVSLTHPRIMMEMINNLKNEVDGLKSKTMSNELEISILKDKLKEDEMEISKLRKEIWCILYQLKDNKSRIECLERKVDDYKQDRDDGKTEESMWNEEEDDEVKHEQIEFTNGISLIKNEELSGNQIKEEKCDEIKAQVKIHIDKTMCWLDQMDGKMCKLELKLKSFRDEWMNVKKFEFIWKVKNFSRKQARLEIGRNRDISSDYFYTAPNGYRMKLWMILNVYEYQKYLTIYFKIVPGIFDSVLKWPFKDRVTLEVIDQNMVCGYFPYVASYSSTADKYRYVFYKPGKSGNEGYGYDIKLNDLLKTSGLIVNDTIFVKCSVTPEAYVL